MRSKTIFWALLALSAFVLFFRLGSYGLVETSDARYAEISSQMVRSGDYLTPRLNYIKHFHKPPLTYWVTAAGYLSLGDNEWGARAGLALTGLATLLITFGLGRRLYGERAGLLAWLALLGMGGFLGAHRLLTTDPLLTLTMTAALYAFWRWQEEEGSGLSHLFFACLGLAMMTKGPVGVLVVWLVILAWAAGTGNLARLKDLRWRAGLAIFALVGLPWYLWVVTHNTGLLRYFLIGQAERIDGDLGHVKPFYFSAEMFVAYCLPWTPFLIPALWRGVKGLRRPGFDEAGKGVFLAAWVLVPVIFFSLPATKLPNYILPALPPAAVLLAGWWQAQVDRGGLTQGGRLAAAALGLVLFVYPVLLVIRPNIIPGMEPLARGVAVLSLAAAALCAAGALRARPWPALIGAAALLPAVMLLTGLQIERVPLRSFRPLGLLAASPPAARVVTYKCRLYSLPFYARQRVIEAGPGRETQFETSDFRPFLPTPEALLGGWERGGRVRCVVPDWALGDFAGQPYRVLGRHHGMILITNETSWK
jgi:4-amino-4-deoxy-L-arabinose transferase-like glycosyltransferase